MIFVNPQWTQDLIHNTADDLAEDFHAIKERIKSDYSIFIRKYIHNPRLDLIDNFNKKGKILDVGCATGAFLYSAKERGWEPFGLELSEISARYGREKKSLNIFTGTLSEANFQSNFFDVVTLWEVIEHLPSPSEYLLEIKRILRNGGVILLSTPNINSLTRFFIGDKWEIISPEEHLHLFSLNTMILLFNKLGFDVLKIKTEDINPLVITRNLISRKRSDNRIQKRKEIVTLKTLIENYRLLRLTRYIMNLILSKLKFGDTLIVLAQKTE
jgi:2-polyprenyl-3-methyl-5-hydroxy-6-metoxy-1,4-benzoquinol methylase